MQRHDVYAPDIQNRCESHHWRQSPDIWNRSLRFFLIPTLSRHVLPDYVDCRVKINGSDVPLFSPQNLQSRSHNGHLLIPDRCWLTFCHLTQWPDETDNIPAVGSKLYRLFPYMHAQRPQVQKQLPVFLPATPVLHPSQNDHDTIPILLQNNLLCCHCIHKFRVPLLSAVFRSLQAQS